MNSFIVAVQKRMKRDNNYNKNTNDASESDSVESRETEMRAERKQSRTEQKVDLLLSSDDIYKHDVTQLTIKNDSK